MLLNSTSLIHAPCDTAPVDPNSAAYLAAYDAAGTVVAHADFDGVGDGYPVNVVSERTPLVWVQFDVPDESDRGRYPIPRDVLVENGLVVGSDGNDHHCILYDPDAGRLWEMYDLRLDANGNYLAFAGATFDMAGGDFQRPAGYTSADAAGLPIFPLLVKYTEAQWGIIDHALRITVPHTRRAYTAPATHFASHDTTATYLPMGARIRLKASFDVTLGGTASGRVQAVLKAWQKYGAIVADNGSLWHVQGVADSRWGTDPNSQEIVDALRHVTTAALEVVQLGPITTG